MIDRRQLLADQSRHGLNEVSVMSHRDLFGTDAKVDELPDQPIPFLSSDFASVARHSQRQHDLRTEMKFSTL
ncbi:MAG: hypothetical protein ACI93T_004022 [Porticoccaceae bacterium]